MKNEKKKLMNPRTKSDFLTTRRTKTTIFWMAGAAVLIATMGISTISSPTPVQAQDVINFHTNANCNSGNEDCRGTSGQVSNEDDFHQNTNCNNKRHTTTGLDCKTNQVTK